MLINDPVYTIFASAEAAQKIVDANAADDGWRFEVSVDPKGSGRAVVKVYDDTGEFLGNL
jgi:hypothetical protein